MTDMVVQPEELPCKRLVYEQHDNQKNMAPVQTEKRFESPLLDSMGSKSEAENSKDTIDTPGKAFKDCGSNENTSKLGERAQLHDIQESLGQPICMVESDDSEMEVDVKVCDICGDAGREDLLAICSKCSDGAEHTYCMREMRQEVPEGDWLCEECQLEVEAKTQKKDVERIEETRVASRAQTYGKRHADVEGAQPVKRQAIDSGMRLPKLSNPSGVAVLSRDSSFKKKIGPSRQTSFGNHRNKDILEATRNNGPRPQPKGSFLKSNSFSGVSCNRKVKLVDEVGYPNKTGTKEHSLAREPPLIRFGKSMSFRSTDIGHSRIGESKAMHPSKFSHAEELKRLKQVKEGKAYERKVSSKLDNSIKSATTDGLTLPIIKGDEKLTPRGGYGSVSTVYNRELKVSQLDKKLTSSEKSACPLARNFVEKTVASVDTLSTNSIRGFTDKKSNRVNLRDEPSSSCSTAERPSNASTELSQDAVSRSRELVHSSKKNIHSHSGRAPIISPGSRGATCAKRTEVGHAADSFLVNSKQSSDRSLMSTRNLREEINEDNKLKAAIKVALRKTGFTRNRGTDKSDSVSVSRVDMNSENASIGQSSVANTLKSEACIDGAPEGHTNLLVGSSKQMTTNDRKSLAIHSTDIMLPSKLGDAEINSLPVLKQPTTDWPCHSAMPLVSRLSATPEPGYIWKGSFELHRGRKLPNLQSGFEAYLSNLASGKVVELVNKLSERVALSEVPRSTIWPTHFHDSGAKEEHIALFFFAKDLESYENSYKGLVDNMIENDLALKGNFDGMELLIFASNQLPENCQRWNMLYFLWGVFRVRKVNDSNPAVVVLSGISCKSGSTASRDVNKVSSGEQPSSFSEVSLVSQNSRLCSNVLQRSVPSCRKPDSKIAASPSSFSEVSLVSQDSRLCSKVLQKSVPSCRKPDSKIAASHVETAGNPQLGLKSSSQANGTIIESDRPERIEIHPSASLVREDNSSVKDRSLCQNRAFVMSIDEYKAPEGKLSSKKNPLEHRKRNEEDEKPINRKNTSDRNLNSWEVTHLKRPHCYLRDAAPQASAVTIDNLWNGVNNAYSDGEFASKKLKPAIGGSADVGSFNPSSLAREGYSKSCVGKLITEDHRTTERHFFPVGPQRGNSFSFGKDERQHSEEDPSLGLSLWDERKMPSKGIPFFLAGNDNRTKRTVDKVEEDTSLALSLGFPFSDEEETSKPVLKTEQLLPEGRRTNTSLLLFHNFADT